MRCRARRSATWLIATPLFPILVAAWAGGARRKGDSNWCSSDARDRESERKKSSRRKRRGRPADDIVDTAVAAGSFGTLAQALEKADLIDTLRGEGPFTVFAPLDDAFDRLPEGALGKLLANKKELTSVLTYHVVPGRVRAEDLGSYAALKTVQGQALDVDTSMGVKVGSAYVVKADIEASNGIVHAIDSVLLPE